MKGELLMVHGEKLETWKVNSQWYMVKNVKRERVMMKGHW